ncbi:MAG: AmmeMemoRadiSam system protein A [Pseudomonadota bacterium]
MSIEARHDGPVLLHLARNSIESAFGAPPATAPDAAWLLEPGACFVTLTQGGELRGCIGTLEPHRPLLEDVRANARAAAFEDPRFPALRAQELRRTEVEVSLLSPMALLPAANEADALAQLRPHVDGLVLHYGPYRSTFLPQVWEQLPEPGRFLAHLKRKAGLPADFWAAELRLYRYTVSKWRESELRAEEASHA